MIGGQKLNISILRYVMNNLMFQQYSYGVLGQHENYLHTSNTSALYAASLENAGYRSLSGVLHAADIDPIRALSSLDNGPTRVIEGSIVGPYISNGQILRGISIYDAPSVRSDSAANILSKF